MFNSDIHTIICDSFQELELIMPNEWTLCRVPLDMVASAIDAVAKADLSSATDMDLDAVLGALHEADCLPRPAES